MPPRVDEREVLAERGGEALAVMPHDGQAAASFRAVGSEGGDDRVAARPQRLPESLDIGGLVGRIDEEVERRAVVPDVVDSLRRPFRRVRDEPMNACASASPSRAFAAAIAAAETSRTVTSS